MLQDDIDVVVVNPNEGQGFSDGNMSNSPQEFTQSQPVASPPQQQVISPQITQIQPPMAINEFKPRENKRYQAAKKTREFTESLRNENTYLQNKLKQMEYDLYRKELETAETEKKLLKLRENYVLDYIKQAKENGDDNAEVEGESILTEIKIEKAIFANKPLPTAPSPEIPQLPREESESIKNFKEYQKKTDWINPESHLYDETLKNRFIELAAVLDSMIKTNFPNPDELIGSKEYYEALDYSIKSERSLQPPMIPAPGQIPVTPTPSYNYNAPLSGPTVDGAPIDWYPPHNTYQPGLYQHMTPGMNHSGRPQNIYFQSPQTQQPVHQPMNMPAAPRYYSGNFRYRY